MQLTSVKRRAHRGVVRSSIMPPLDGGGEGGRTRRVSPVQQTICNHTDLPVDLLGRPVGSQATAHDRGWPTVKCELK